MNLEELVGTWTLLSWSRRKVMAQKSSIMGQARRASHFLMQADDTLLPSCGRIAPNTRPMPFGRVRREENKETVDGTITYFGTYSASEADNSITIHVEGSSFSELEWHGSEALCYDHRNRLTLTVRPPGGDIVDVIWKREELTGGRQVRLWHDPDLQRCPDVVRNAHQSGRPPLRIYGFTPWQSTATVTSLIDVNIVVADHLAPSARFRF